MNDSLKLQTASLDKKWHALYVNSRSEKKVGDVLISKGITTYVPLGKTLRQWSDRKKWVTTPLMPGYVFVQISEAMKDLVLQTQGVVSFVKYNKRYAVIRQSEIDTLKNIEQYGYEIAIVSERIEEGDTITIFQGPLKGLQAQVVEVSNDNSVLVFLLQDIGQSFKVKIPIDVLKKESSKVC